MVTPNATYFEPEIQSRCLVYAFVQGNVYQRVSIDLILHFISRTPGNICKH